MSERAGRRVFLRGARACASLGLSAACLSCAVGTTPCEPRSTYAVDKPPPVPLPEEVPAPPAPGMIWAAGYWHWDSLRYVWSPGHWATPPPGGHWHGVEVGREGAASSYRPAGVDCDRPLR